MSADPKDVDFDVLELLEQRKRNDVIEQCALVAETAEVYERVDAEAIAAAIRGLKS